MKMGWIHRNRTPTGMHGVWETTFVDVKQVRWNQVKFGDIVFIPGNLVDGFPTKLYGRHRVIDPKRQTLEGANGKEFHEDWPFIYKEIK